MRKRLADTWTQWLRRPRAAAARPFGLERLEDRLAPAGDTLATADLLAFDAANRTEVAGLQLANVSLEGRSDARLFAVRLNRGDELTAALHGDHLSGTATG